LVLLHGFTQTGQAWGPVVDALASLGSPWPIVLPDAPGHGGSAGVEADLWETADLLADLVPDAAFWSGYSMGGRAALHVALAYPQLVERLVLISTSAGIEDTAEREARAAADEALARQLEDVGVGPFLEDWLAQPLFATMTSAQAALDQRRANTAAGLASSLRRAGAGAQAPLWDRLAELARRSLPVLVIAGELDARYRGHAERMVAAIGPTASLVVIEGAGHACPLERPAAVASALARFLSD
jgi:2-succinyl-6-hydroxy-2,4-cyclohexadiene-1-carboxylate synthase